MPCSSAASTTSRVRSASMRTPNALQPRPSAETARPLWPSWRYSMSGWPAISAHLELEQHHAGLVVLDVHDAGLVDHELLLGLPGGELDLLLGRGVHVQLALTVGVDAQG